MDRFHLGETFLVRRRVGWPAKEVSRTTEARQRLSSLRVGQEHPQVASETTFRGRVARSNRRHAVILRAGTPLDIRRDLTAGIPDTTAQEARPVEDHPTADRLMADRPMEDHRDTAALPIVPEAIAHRLMEAAAATADAATVDLLMVEEAVARRLPAEDGPMAAGVRIARPAAVRAEVLAEVVVPTGPAMEDDTKIS